MRTRALVRRAARFARARSLEKATKGNNKKPEARHRHSEKSGPAKMSSYFEFPSTVVGRTLLPARAAEFVYRKEDVALWHLAQRGAAQRMTRARLSGATADGLAAALRVAAANDWPCAVQALLGAKADAAGLLADHWPVLKHCSPALFAALVASGAPGVD
jgi:hypothetical protein